MSTPHRTAHLPERSLTYPAILLSVSGVLALRHGLRFAHSCFPLFSFHFRLFTAFAVLAADSSWQYQQQQRQQQPSYMPSAANGAATAAIRR